MTPFEDPWIRLARRIGLEVEYRDAYGVERYASRQSIEAVLSALGFGDDPVLAEIRLRRMTEGRLLPPVVAVTVDAPVTVTIAVPAMVVGLLELTLRLEDETEERFTVELAEQPLIDTIEIGSDRFDRRTLTLPYPLPAGYHCLVATKDAISAETLIIVAPPSIWRPWNEVDGEEEGDGNPGRDFRYWGLQVQLYGLRSPRNWGIGDFTDLADLMTRAAAIGAAAVGINPIHALFTDEPEKVSPYSPSSRLYRNYIYLDVEAIEEFEACKPARELVASLAFQRELGRLRTAPLVDYSGVAAAKLRVLRLIHGQGQHHKKRVRAKLFDAFKAQKGESLRLFATFQVLRETLSMGDWSQRNWRTWPEAFRDPASPDVAHFAEEHADEIDFVEWLQWQVDVQLTNAGYCARSAGMPFGLYADLAVGVDPSGAEAWWNQRLVVSGVGIGAPPDLLAPGGQDWGLPPLNPVTLAEQKLDPFIQMIRSNMQGAGALRIDHVMGLLRLYYVPHGVRATEGLYVRYPVDALFAVIALESHRHRCLVIGEDLGTLPLGFADKLRATGILSYKVAYFENDAGRFHPPETYPAEALACVSTHDLPPLAYYWRGEDLRLRLALGLASEQQTLQGLEYREVERQGLIELVRSQGLDDGGSNPDQPPVFGLHRALARTPSRLLMVQFEDMLPQVEPANVPGTVDQVPNWRRKLPYDIGALFADRLVHGVFQVLTEERPSRFLAKAPDEWVEPPLGATYRLQFNSDFTLAHAVEILPYLKALGITHVYASSYLSARVGSTHGYDVTDHGMINPEVGGEEAFNAFVGALKQNDLGQILDFVPNHMGIGKASNVWWLSVLEWGLASPFAKYFDIDWRSPRRLLKGRVLLPVLGDHYGAVLERGELKLRLEETAGTLSLWYFEHRLPLRPQDYASVLEAADHDVVQAAARDFAGLPVTVARARRDAVGMRAARLKSGLAQLVQSTPSAKIALQRVCEAISADPLRLHALLERQHYRLAYWRTAADEINYRRFFDINDLAAIRIEDGDVFEAVHRGLARLLGENAIQGLRIDHIDGLADPVAYLRRLRAFAARYRPNRTPLPVYVEKILIAEESLRTDWPVAGTTGYEVANLLTHLHVDPAGASMLARLYASLSGEKRPFDAVAVEAKHETMATMMGSELERLANQLDRLAKQSVYTRDFTQSRLKVALAEIVAGMPVYRTYMTERGVSDEDRAHIRRAVATARGRWRGTDRDILDFVHRALTGELSGRDDYRAADIQALMRRFQQYTGPVMAKSVEDTAFYRFHQLAALNEVGGAPERLDGISIADFHTANYVRWRDWPQAMLGSSTHDTKRGEDSRARLVVLSERAKDWAQAVRDWTEMTRSWRGDHGPSDNDAYLIFQTLVAIWPMDPAQADEADFADRLRGYVIKAVREAKLATSWTDQSEEYEADCLAFIDRLLAPATDQGAPNPFRAAFRPMVGGLARIGALNSIAQTVLKLTIPGVPDLYQGTELWNLSLADPDNRRPVDYGLRQAYLSDPEPAWSDRDYVSGQVKLHVTRALLHLRQAHPELFAPEAEYRPLSVAGPDSERIIAFARVAGAQTLVVLAGRLMAPLADGHAVRWGRGSTVALPEGRLVRDILDTHRSTPSGTIVAADLFGGRPVAVWLLEN